MKNMLIFLIVVFLLTGCASVQSATDQPSGGMTETSLPTIPSPSPHPTEAWPPRMTIPDEEIPAECLTRDPLLSSTPQLIQYMEYLGYEDLSCRMFLYSPDKHFLTYVQVTYMPERDSPGNPNDGALETIKIVKVPSGEYQYNYAVKGEGFVVTLEWQSPSALHFQTGGVSGLFNDLLYDAATDSISLVQPTPTPAPRSLAQTLDGIYIDQLAWSPDSQHLATSTCYETCQLQMRNAADLSQLWQTNVDDATTNLYFSPDGISIAALTMQNITKENFDGRPLEADKTLIQWFNTQDGALIAKAEVDGAVIQFEYNPSGETVAALARTADASFIWLFNSLNYTLIRKWDANDDLAHILHFNPWANQIATAGWDLTMWDASSGEEIWKLSPEGEEYTQTGQAKLAVLNPSPNLGGGCVDAYGSLIFSKEKPILIASSLSTRYQGELCDRISLWNLESRQVSNLVVLTGSNGYDLQSFFAESMTVTSITDMAMNFDEQTSTVTLMKQYGLFVWNTQSGDTEITPREVSFNPELSFLSHAIIHPKGGLMALWAETGGDGMDHLLNLYDLNSGQSVDPDFGIYGYDEATMLSVAFSPDGHWLAATNQSGSLMVWELDEYLR